MVKTTIHLPVTEKEDNTQLELIMNKTTFNNILFSIFVLINVLDFYTTKVLVDMDGIGIEGNPIMLYAMTILGATWAMFTIKMTVLVPMLVFINKSDESFKHLPPNRITIVMYVMIAVLGLIVLNNFILILLSQLA